MRRFAVVAFVACLCFSACDLDPFGLARKKIGSGYCLYVGDSEHDFAVLAPGASTGSVITQIGWRKPYIIAQLSEGERRWEVFDSSARTLRLLTYAQLRADPAISTIPVVSARDAWERLQHRQGQW